MVSTQDEVPAAHGDAGLFRPQVAQANERAWLGAVQLATPLSHAAWAWIGVIIGAVIVGWLLFGHYTRREHVAGVLVPQAGLIELTARSSGVVSQLRVQEGSRVRAGEALLVLSGERSSEALGNTTALISSSLHQQQARLQADLLDAQRLSDQQATGLRIQQGLLQEQLGQLDAQLAIQHQQVVSQNALLEKIRPLLRNGYISAMQVQQQQTQALQAEAESKALSRQRLTIAEQLDGAVRQAQQLPLTTQAKLNEMRRQLAQMDQALAQNEVDRAVVLQAPHAGVVSSLLVKPGQAVSAGQAVLAIVPEASTLQADLLVPSRAIGFVHEGTPVALHYEAFPYQKFGVQRGIVRQVSQSALTPYEVTTLWGKTPPGEALYRVQVTLHAQTIDAYGRAQTLKPGMALDADLLLDRRRLIEWLLEPLYGMRGNAQVAS